MTGSNCKFPCPHCYFIGNATKKQHHEHSKWKDYTSRDWSADIDKFINNSPSCGGLIQIPVSKFVTQNTEEYIAPPILHINLGVTNCILGELHRKSENDAEIQNVPPPRFPSRPKMATNRHR